MTLHVGGFIHALSTNIQPFFSCADQPLTNRPGGPITGHSRKKKEEPAHLSSPSLYQIGCMPSPPRLEWYVLVFDICNSVYA